MKGRDEFLQSKCWALANTIALADDIAAGRTTLEQLSSEKSRVHGERLAEASGVLALCKTLADRRDELPAVAGMYERFAGYYLRLAERVLANCDEFETDADIEKFCATTRDAIEWRVSRMHLDPIAMLDIAMQTVEDSKRREKNPDRNWWQFGT